MRKNDGFTLLEIIIVIIIVGILTALALPKMIRNIEFSRSTEALNSLSAISRAARRCFLYAQATNKSPLLSCNELDHLDIDDPGASPGTHFTYDVVNQSNFQFLGYRATRNNRDNGDGTSSITYLPNHRDLSNRLGCFFASGVFSSLTNCQATG